MKVVLSIGNPIKSDDNIGNIVLERIEIGNVLKIAAETTPENFMERLKEFDEIIIIDALQFEGRAGDVRVFRLGEIEANLSSTHNIPIKMINDVLENPRIYVIGIKPKNIDFGEKLSEDLEDRLDEISRKVEKIINSL